MNPVEYITDVLDRVDKIPGDRLGELLPDRWKPSPTAQPTDFDA